MSREARVEPSFAVCDLLALFLEGRPVGTRARHVRLRFVIAVVFINEGSDRQNVCSLWDVGIVADDTAVGVASCSKRAGRRPPRSLWDVGTVADDTAVGVSSRSKRAGRQPPRICVCWELEAAVTRQDVRNWLVFWGPWLEQPAVGLWRMARTELGDSS